VNEYSKRQDGSGMGDGSGTAETRQCGSDDGRDDEYPGTPNRQADDSLDDTVRATVAPGGTQVVPLACKSCGRTSRLTEVKMPAVIMTSEGPVLGVMMEVLCKPCTALFEIEFDFLTYQAEVSH